MQEGVPAKTVKYCLFFLIRMSYSLTVFICGTNTTTARTTPPYKTRRN